MNSVIRNYICHRGNALHVYCWLLRAGLRRSTARRIATAYERLTSTYTMTPVGREACYRV